MAVRFLNSLDEVLERITLNRRIYREVEPGIRKCRMKTFRALAVSPTINTNR
ncbi:MAG: hypothetical protein WCA32_11590 [Chromatiaceae bacterium]